MSCDPSILCLKSTTITIVHFHCSCACAYCACTCLSSPLSLLPSVVTVQYEEERYIVEEEAGYVTLALVLDRDVAVPVTVSVNLLDLQDGSVGDPATGELQVCMHLWLDDLYHSSDLDEPLHWTPHAVISLIFFLIHNTHTSSSSSIICLTSRSVVQFMLYIVVVRVV